MRWKAKAAGCVFAQTVLVCPQINQPTERLQIHLFHALLDDVRKHWRNYTLHSPPVLSLSVKSVHTKFHSASWGLLIWWRCEERAGVRVACHRRRALGGGPCQGVELVILPPLGEDQHAKIWFRPPLLRNTLTSENYSPDDGIYIIKAAQCMSHDAVCNSIWTSGLE
jgi:hypothetical protein